MRSDMAKVVTEAPRSGSSNRSLKTARRLYKDEFDADDHGPSRAPCRKHDKSFSDVLNPLRRYLAKQVGRPWNCVYSELSQVLDKRSLSGLHIWDHVYQEVLRHVDIRHGKFYSIPYMYQLSDSRYKQLYVNPITGLLCEAPYKKYVRPNRSNPNEKPLDPMRTLLRQEGIWYLAVYAMRDREQFSTVKGVVVSKIIKERVLVKKQQLNKKTLKRYQLVNSLA